VSSLRAIANIAGNSASGTRAFVLNSSVFEDGPPRANLARSQRTVA
jgi:hypothetical protein